MNTLFQIILQPDCVIIGSLGYEVRKLLLEKNWTLQKFNVHHDIF